MCWLNSSAGRTSSGSTYVVMSHSLRTSSARQRQHSKLKAYKVCIGQPLRYLRALVVFAGRKAVINIQIEAPSC